MSALVDYGSSDEEAEGQNIDIPDSEVGHHSAVETVLFQSQLLTG